MNGQLIGTVATIIIIITHPTLRNAFTIATSTQTSRYKVRTRQSHYILTITEAYRYITLQTHIQNHLLINDKPK